MLGDKIAQYHSEGYRMMERPIGEYVNKPKLFLFGEDIDGILRFLVGFFYWLRHQGWRLSLSVKRQTRAFRTPHAVWHSWKVIQRDHKHCQIRSQMERSIYMNLSGPRSCCYDYPNRPRSRITGLCSLERALRWKTYRELWRPKRWFDETGRVDSVAEKTLQLCQGHRSLYPWSRWEIGTRCYCRTNFRLFDYQTVLECGCFRIFYI